MAKQLHSSFSSPDDREVLVSFPRSCSVAKSSFNEVKFWNLSK